MIVTEDIAIQLGGERHTGSHPYIILFYTEPIVTWNTKENCWRISGGSEIWHDNPPTIQQLKHLLKALKRNK